MSQADTIRLLIIQDDTNEVERLLSMLRNSGKSTRAQHVPSIEGFEKLLSDQAWDLLLALENAKSCDPKTALRTIKKLDKDIPAIFLTEADIEEFNMALIDGMKAGARDVVLLDDDQHLLMVMSREIANLQERREKRIADRKLKEAERKCQQLLDNSKDAIAYVEDGLFLYANQSFAERFKYDSIDEILSIPVIDVIAPKDQEKYKSFMKSFKLIEDGQTSELELCGIANGKTEFNIGIEVSHALYENEPCTQLLVAAKLGMDSAELEAEIKKASSMDALTGTFNRVYFNTSVNNAVKDACEKEKFSSLHVMSIDLFEDMRISVGLTGRDSALADIASYIKTLIPADATLARISDEEFAFLIPGIDKEKQTNLSNKICEMVSNHICKAGDKTIQMTLSIGICPITEKITSADQVFERAHIACNEVRANGKGGVGNGCKFYEPKLSDIGQEESADIISEIVDLAIDKDKLVLKFQPIISLRGEPTEYYEVFLSMPPDEQGKVISAEEIFSSASRNDELARKLDRWCFINSLKRLSESRKDGRKSQLLINTTSATLRDGSFSNWAASAFKAANLPIDSVVFQFAESDATSYLVQAKAFVDTINQHGGKCALSHFGCSLDPFKTLSHLAVDMVKIHGSFSIDIQQKGENPDPLKELLAKVNESGKQSIVPFVENATLLATLWQAGAHFIQGNYVQAPGDKLDFVFNEE